MERLWHLRLSSRKRLPLFPTETSQHRAVRRLASATIGRLVLFDLIHEHGHLVAFCVERELGVLRRTIRQSLGPVAAQPIEPLWYDAVEGRNHMRSLLRYALTQLEHHELPGQPALWAGSCFLDLVGARAVPGLALRLEEALPGVRLREVQEMVGLPSERILPANDDQIRGLGAARLASATASALGLDPGLEGKRPEVVRARRLVVQVARRLRFPWGEISRTLRISEATMFRLANGPVEPRGEQVVRVRLALEERVLSVARPVIVPRGKVGGSR